MSAFGGFRRRSAAVVVACALGVCLAGCGAVYLEQGPTVAPAPDAAEQQRQAMATQAADLAQLAQSCAAGGQGDSALPKVAAAIAQHAADHEAAWGGVWEAFPSGGASASPSGATSATATPTASGVSPTTPAPPPEASSGASATASGTPALPKGCDPGALAEALQKAADDAHDLAVSTDDTTLVPTFAAIATSRYVDLGALSAAVTTIEDVKIPLKSLPALDLASPPGPQRQLDAVIRAEDAAGFGEEFAAARMDDKQGAGVAGVAAGHREQAAQMAAGVTPDPRDGLYDVPTDTPADELLGFAATLEAKVGDAYADLVAASEGSLRGQALAAMVTQYARAQQWGHDITSFPGAVPGAVQVAEK